ncbi:MAG: CoA-binding protein [Desulforhopalus sp.]
MLTFDALRESSEIASLLRGINSIAIAGLSPKENRPSNMVARYLLDAGYTVFPVNPGQNQILGNTCYPDLLSLPCPVDLVNIFRRSSDVPAIVEQAVEMVPLPRAIWMQQGIINEAAAELARSRDMFVVMDRCIKVDHANLLGR